MQRKISTKVLFVLVFLTLSTALKASVQYRLEDFEEKGLKGGLSYVRVNGKNFAKVGLSPDLQLGAVGVGLDLNAYIPTDGGAVPSSLQSVVVRSVSYDHNHQAGIKWGRLTRVNFGYGLLMNNYDSGSFGSVEFNNEKAGTLLYGTYGDLRVDALWTASNVKGGRISYTLPESIFLGSPIVFGANYVTDADGINRVTEAGTIVSRNIQSTIGFDIAAPIGGEFFTLYAEYAQFREQGQGSGASAGFKGSFSNQLDYRLEYRSLGAKFVPGYFNSVYEATSFNFNNDAPKGTLSGVLGGVGFGLMDNYLKADLVYEAYQGFNPLLTAAVGWKKMSNTVGVINYSKPFSSGGNAVAEANILYYTGGLFDYVATIKRVYTTNDLFTESYAIGARVNLSSLFPNIPFIK